MELELEPLNLPSDQERPIVIAGPCSAETEEQVMTTAKQLAAKGCHMFRAGVWKPRTKPGGFEGNGEAALPWMKQVKKETGMLTATEVGAPAYQPSWYQATRCHPPRFLQLRQEDLPQSPYVADSYRAAPPHSSVAYHLRP